MRILSTILLLFLLASCVTVGGRPEPTTSSKIAFTALDKCQSSQCFIDFAQLQLQHTNQKETEKLHGEIAYTYFVIGDNTKALNHSNKIVSGAAKNTFEFRFGYPRSGSIIHTRNSFLKWNNGKVILPESLIGFSDIYNLIYGLRLVDERTFEEAFNYAKTQKITAIRNVILHDLSIKQSKANQIENAFNSAKFIIRDDDKKFYRDFAIRSVFRQLYSGNYIQSTIENYFARITEDDLEAAHAGILEAYAEQGKIDGVMEQFEKISNPLLRSHAYRHLMSYYASTGDIQNVADLLHEMHDYDTKSFGYHFVAASFARNGHQKELSEFIQLLDNKEKKVFALAYAGKETRSLEYYNRALQLNQKFSKEMGVPTQNSAMGRVVEFMAETGFTYEALNQLRAVDESISDDSQIMRLVKRLSAKQRFFEGLRNSENRPTTSEEMLKLLHTNVEITPNKEVDLALFEASDFFTVDGVNQNLLDVYLNYSQKITNPESKEEAVARIIPHLVYQGQRTKALQMVSNMEFTAPRAFALLQLAQLYSKN